MSAGRSLRRTAGFAVAYLIASYAGRLTVMDATNLSLVWPAAGVSAVWFATQWRSRLLGADLLALAAITVVINTYTGAPLALALCFVAANVAQACAFGYLLRRWLPRLWGAGGTEPLCTLAQLWRITAAAVIATVLGALIGPTGVWIESGHYSWPATSVWLARNTVSILLITVTALRLGHLLHTRRRQSRPAGLRASWTAMTGLRQAEYLAVVALSAAAYALVFGAVHGLPLAFILIVMTVWAGLRMHTTFVVLHDLTFGTAAILFTLHGDGPFALISSNPIRALIAQLFIGTVAVVGLALALGRDERQTLITDLRATQQHASQQAQLMGTIFDAMSEGLGVIDEHGTYLMRNPAAGRLLGVTSTSGRIEPGSYYGLFHPDGTPFDDAELPHRRALAGEPVHQVDVLVRNPALPDGRILSISATTLPTGPDGDRRAVTVFHDVTAERRHRDELAAFAGVVAHDLLNPLTTIEGWSETLAGEHPDAAPDLARIQRAAARMRNLINDLLAYTTSRDAALSPTDTDLGHLVADITAARTDHAQSTGTPTPRIDHRAPHHVHADPVLLRQLLDNLIGNAIKYTAPGITPHITVISAPAGPDRIRVEITDNGIGIPAGQHDAVFANFHRAHRNTKQTGTGLGLAICKRIVERHGGAITAHDNPGGGTRIEFTLPAGRRTTPPGAAGRPPAAMPASPISTPGEAIATR